MNSDLRECFFWGLCKQVTASSDLWPQEMSTFFENTCNGRSLAWDCQKAVSVPFRRACAFVMGGLWGFMHTCVLSRYVLCFFSRNDLKINLPESAQIWRNCWLLTCFQSCDKKFSYSISFKFHDAFSPKKNARICKHEIFRAISWKKRKTPKPKDPFETQASSSRFKDKKLVYGVLRLRLIPRQAPYFKHVLLEILLFLTISKLSHEKPHQNPSTNG